VLWGYTTNDTPASQPACIACQRLSRCGGASISYRSGFYYAAFKLPIPAGVVLEVGELELLPDGKLAASSRRGDIYTITNPFSNAPSELHLPGIRSATRLPLLHDVAYYTLNHIPAAN